MIRIDTTETEGESTAWTPTGPFTIQAMAAQANVVVVELQARLDALAPWARLAVMRPAAEPFIHCALHPAGDVRLVFYGNRPGEALKAWSVE